MNSEKFLIRSMKSFLPILLMSLLLMNACKKVNPPAENISVSPLFSNNMVLQQKQENPVWGKAEPGGKVSLSLNEIETEGIVGKDGKWKVKLPPMAAGGPYELVISGADTLRIQNVMFGEVWVCSGQSNMEMPIHNPVAKVLNSLEEVANANYPNIRLLQVNKFTDFHPQDNFESEGWKECSPETVPDFSAAAYFFGRDLHKSLDVPIGLIQAAYGGTVIESWTSGASLKTIPEFTDTVNTIEADKSTREERIEIENQKREIWPNKVEEILRDRGTFDHGYQSSDFNMDDWKTMNLPTVWEKLAIYVDGVVWFSKEINIPESWSGEDLTLSLGKINDYDITWFNGTRVGRGIDVTDSRNYKVPASIINTGQNRIVVQVLDIGNVGGMYGPAEEMELSSANKSISLVGDWKYKIDPIKIEGKEFPEKQDQNAGVNRPTVLYNGMINPLLPYGISGVIWTQGASNADRAYQYRTLI